MTLGMAMALNIKQELAFMKVIINKLYFIIIKIFCYEKIKYQENEKIERHITDREMILTQDIYNKPILSKNTDLRVNIKKQMAQWGKKN